MRIEFKRAGGFAAPAMRRDYTVDLDNLAADEAEELRKLVKDIDVGGLTKRSASNRPVPDAFHYRVVIEDSDGRHTIEASDADMPESLRPLINWLTKHASPGG